MSVADELLAARDRIADLAHWCQDDYFVLRDVNGRALPCSPTWRAMRRSLQRIRELPIEQLQMCAHGTLLYGEVSVDARVLIEGVCTEWYDSTLRAVNDLDGHDAIIKVFDEAIRRAKDMGL